MQIFTLLLLIPVLMPGLNGRNSKVKYCTSRVSVSLGRKGQLSISTTSPFAHPHILRTKFTIAAHHAKSHLKSLRKKYARMRFGTCFVKQKTLPYVRSYKYFAFSALVQRNSSSNLNVQD